MKKCIQLPSGIGDVAWALFKLWHVRDEIERIEIADGWPHRTAEFVELLGIPASYGPYSYVDILMSERVNRWETWDQIRQEQRAGVLIAPNSHLEAGNRIETWLPDLPCTYHLPIQGTPEQKLEADRMLAKLRNGADRPLIGISCASYRGSEAWKTWDAERWVDFLGRVMHAGWKPVLLGGFWDDITSDVAATLKLPDLVGKTHIGLAIELQRRLDSYFGFSSGLGVIRVILDKPCMMLWPDHEPDQRSLSTSWVPQDMLDSGRYAWRPWRPPAEIWPTVENYLELCLAEAGSRGAAAIPSQAEGAGV